MNVQIRRVKEHDEAALAHIQTESWKAAFADILDKETLERCTNLENATSMYKSLLEENKGNGYLLTVDDEPHSLAYWDAARDESMSGKAELIAIHSLPGNWHKGFGSMMMDRVLSDIKEAGYSEVMLWVFTGNERARSFYEKKGFVVTDKVNPCLGTEEVCYLKKF